MHKFSWGAVVCAVLALSACGGGGGGGDNSGPVTPALVTASGVVIDGTLANATVFLDLNGNGMQDAGEPSTTTGANGAFSLQATAAQLSSSSMIALATAGTTTDSDIPGKTVSANFSLIAPPGNYQVISPITSLVVANIQSAGSASAAASAVAATLNIPSAALNENYVAAGDTSVHNLAAAVAQGIASVQSQSTAGTSLAAQYQSLNTVVANHLVPNLASIESASSPAAAAALAVHDINSIYSLGGSVRGLKGAGLVLANGTSTVAPAIDASGFTFPNLLESGSSYSVTVQAQPAGQTCSVSNGSGQIANASTSTVQVSCADNAQVRLINASAGYPSLDMTVNNVSLGTAISYGTAGAYGSVDTSNGGMQVTASGTTVLSRGPLGLMGEKFSMIVYGWPNNIYYTLLQESEPAPAAGSAKLLVLNLAPDAGSLNVYLTGGTPVTGAAPFASAVLGRGGSGYLLQTAGTYHLRVTGSTSSDVNTDVRLDIPAITLADASVNTLILTPTTGGVLVNAMTVVQQGAVASYSSTKARVRVISSVLGAAGTRISVQAARNGNSLLDTSSASPVGLYSIVPATNDPITATMTVNVNGSPVSSTPLPAQTPLLAAGSDYTMLIWGTASAPQVVLIPDDNRLPESGYARFRLINGDPSRVMSMTLDFSVIASNVIAGTVSTPYQTYANSGSIVTVNTTTSIVPVFSQMNFNMANQAIYTVYMLANINSTNNLDGLLSRDR